MKTRYVLAIALVTALVGWYSGTSVAEDKPDPQQPPAKAEGEVDPMAMVQHMMATHAPGPHQAFLAKLAGEWDAKTKFWMDPAAPPQESTATCTNTLEFGGRYLRTEFHGDMGGQKFEGKGIMCHDNMKKEFQQIWYDSSGWGSGLSWQSGACNADKTVVTLHGEFNGGKFGKHKTRMVYTLKDENNWQMQNFTVMGDKEFMDMEIIYTRKAK